MATIPQPPTRFPQGVNNVPAKIHPLSGYGLPDPYSWATYANDFFTYAAGDWVVTESGSGSQALVAGDGGIFGLTTGATSTNSEWLQLGPASTGCAILDTTRYSTIFRIVCSVNTNTAAQVYAGLVNEGATAFAPTDGIFFTKAAGTGAVVANYKNATGTINQTQTISTADPTTSFVAATLIDLAFMWSPAAQAKTGGVGKLSFYINQSFVGDMNPTTVTTATLAPAFGIKTSAAVAKTLKVDYVFYAKRRNMVIP